MTKITEEIRAVSDKIWNAGAKLTHNQLDEILAAFATQIEKAKVEEVATWVKEHEQNLFAWGLEIPEEIRKHFLTPES